MAGSVRADPIRKAFASRAAAALNDMAASLDTQALANALRAPEGVEMLARAVLLAPPPPHTLRPALHRARLRGVEARNALLERLSPWITTAQVAKTLGVATGSVERRRQRKGLLSAAFRRGDIRYPSFQFVDGQVAPAVTAALKTLSAESPMFLLAFFAEPRTELRGLSPKAAIETGAGEAVQALARAAAAAHG